MAREFWGTTLNVTVPSATGVNWAQQTEQNELNLRRMRRQDKNEERENYLNSSAQQFYAPMLKHWKTAEANGISRGDFISQISDQMESQMEEQGFSPQLQARIRALHQQSAVDEVARLQKAGRSIEAEKLANKFGITGINPLKTAMMSRDWEKIQGAVKQMTGQDIQLSPDGKTIIMPNGRAVPYETGMAMINSTLDTSSLWNLLGSEFTRQRDLDMLNQWRNGGANPNATPTQNPAAPAENPAAPQGAANAGAQAAQQPGQPWYDPATQQWIDPNTTGIEETLNSLITPEYMEGYGPPPATPVQDLNEATRLFNQYPQLVKNMQEFGDKHYNWSEQVQAAKQKIEAINKQYPQFAQAMMGVKMSQQVANMRDTYSNLVKAAAFLKDRNDPRYAVLANRAKEIQAKLVQLIGENTNYSLVTNPYAYTPSSLSGLDALNRIATQGTR